MTDLIKATYLLIMPRLRYLFSENVDNQLRKISVVTPAKHFGKVVQIRCEVKANDNFAVHRMTITLSNDCVHIVNMHKQPSFTRHEIEYSNPRLVAIVGDFTDRFLDFIAVGIKNYKLACDVDVDVEHYQRLSR